MGRDDTFSLINQGCASTARFSVFIPADMSRGVFPASLANPGTGKSVACVRA